MNVREREEDANARHEGAEDRRCAGGEFAFAAEREREMMMGGGRGWKRAHDEGRPTLTSTFGFVCFVPSALIVCCSKCTFIPVLIYMCDFKVPTLNIGHLVVSTLRIINQIELQGNWHFLP